MFGRKWTYRTLLVFALALGSTPRRDIVFSSFSLLHRVLFISKELYLPPTQLVSLVIVLAILFSFVHLIASEPSSLLLEFSFTIQCPFFRYSQEEMQQSLGSIGHVLNLSMTRGTVLGRVRSSRMRRRGNVFEVLSERV
jgi:hypothetical protein